MSHDNNEHQTFLHSTPAQEPEHRTPSVQVHGHGRVIIQHGTDAAQREVMQAPAFQATRVHNGPVKLSMGPGGEVISAGAARHVHTDAGTQGGSVMATLRTGSQPSVELNPGDPSSRTLLSTAAREGLIRLNAAGQWEDVGTPAAPRTADAAKQASDELARANAPEVQQTEHVEADMQTLAAADLAAVNEAIADIPDHAWNAALNRGIGMVTGTHTAEEVGLQLAREAGIPEDEGIALAENLLPLYQAKGDAIFERMGVSAEDGSLYRMYEWMKTEKAPTLTHGIRGYLNGDPTLLKRLASEWLAGQPRGGKN